METVTTADEQKYSLLKMKVAQTYITILNKLTADFNERTKSKSDLELVTSRLLDFVMNKTEILKTFLDDSSSDEWRVEQAMQDQTTRNQILALINQTNKKVKKARKPKDLSN